MGELFYLIVGIVLLIMIICFFVLCVKVSKIEKGLLTDEDEYYLAKMMGDKQKTYYYLQRYMYLKGKKKDLSSDETMLFYREFKALGMGIPDLPIFKRCKEKEEWEKED